MEVKDLHLCDVSSKSCSATNSTESSCVCPPEYYCAQVCAEGYSVSTLISWQHFPRSTSSPSHCDMSTETRKSVSSTPYSSEKKEKESTEASSTEYPITKSISQLNALHYLKIRYVFDLLNFMIGHLVCNEPDDPVEFLVDLLEKCLKYRHSFGEPPVLFTHSHIKSLYKAFDPFERGVISLDQYREAMNTLGLTNGPTSFNDDPPVNEEGDVKEEDFVFEAQRCVIENLKKMLRIPKIWEENRLIWKRKMAKKQKLLKKVENESNSDNKRSENLLDIMPCECIEEKKPEVEDSKEEVVCCCSTHTAMKYEPEQLYLEPKISSSKIHI